MKSAKIENVYKWIIVFDEQEITRLIAEIKDILIEDIQDEQELILLIKIGYSDKISFQTDKLEDLLNDENSVGKEIVNISVDCKNGDKRIYVLFGGKEESTKLEIEGPDRQWILVNKSRIDDRLERFRVRRVRSGMLIFLISTAINILITFYLGYINNNFPAIFIQNEAGAYEPGSGLAILVVIYIVVIIFSIIIIERLYPNKTFLIGGGKKRDEKKEKLRLNMIWVVLVGSIIAVLVAYVFK